MKYILVLAPLLIVACFSKKPETGLEGKALPEFSMLLTDSITWVNSKDMKNGKPAVFFLFTPQCPHCKSQVSKIVNDIDALKDISIFMITPAPIGQIKNFSKKYGLYKYSNIQVGRDTANFFGQYMNVKGVPFLAVYNKDMRLTRVFSGVTNTNLIKAVTAE